MGIFCMVSTDHKLRGARSAAPKLSARTRLHRHHKFGPPGLAPIVALCLVVFFLGLAARADGHDRTASSEYRERVNLLETWIEAVLDFDRLPGMSIAVVHDQELVFAKGFGYADVERSVKATPGTIYSICSISKLYTAIGLMQLRDAGKLALDDQVSKHLPWFAPEMISGDAPSPTLRDLLRHSSGLPCEPDHTVWPDPERLNPSREDLIQRVSALKMSYPTNIELNYSNLGYSLLGEVISVSSGLSYEEYVQKHIVDRLGMEATTPYMPEQIPGGEVAVGYGRWPRQGSRVRVPVRDQRAMSPASAFASTVEDLAKFAMWQFRVLDEKETDVLSPQSLREMQTVQWSDPDWGLGFAIWQMEGKQFFGHQGGCPGFKSQIILCPEEKIAVAVMINATDAPQFTLVFRAYEIMAPALKAATGEEEGPDKWARYAGYYTADESWSEAEVLEWDGSLAVMWVPTPDPVGSLVRMQRVEGEVFRQVKGDGELGKHYVFRADSAGDIVGMRFNNNLLKKTVR